MPVAWFVAQLQPDPDKPTRMVSATDQPKYLDAIRADGGKLGYKDILGASVVGGVQASGPTLQLMNVDPLITPFAGVNNLSDSLAQLTDPQWTAYRNKAISLGYSAAEWDAAFPLTRDNYILKDVIRFLLKRRISPRWDVPSSSVIYDGPVVSNLGTPDDIQAHIA